ncbi:enoyl-CoA hydratase [Brevibacterium sp.]|uniref:enoyl-CoA hydratase n=1 Tax=Brevibacterium sp. TaxID=1701 RepID=UPI002812080C|nr:enoyl-CoA hydratase [Brevibacterium sp.]
MSTETTTETTSDLLVEETPGVLTVTFNRPHARNAMTWEMYTGLAAACDRADASDDIRVMVLQGSGEKAFVAGTDISQFATFDGPRGVEYEQQISAILSRLRAVNVPVIAAIKGYCVGGGLGIAACTDIRIASASAKFGVPIARTLGNCLSVDTLSLLSELLGRARVVDMLLRARFIEAEEAREAGFVGLVTDAVDQAVADWTTTLLGHAPLTMWSVKESMRRLSGARGQVDDHDIVERIYGSQDFHNAVEAFVSKTPYEWQGR